MRKAPAQADALYGEAGALEVGNILLPVRPIRNIVGSRMQPMPCGILKVVLSTLQSYIRQRYA